MITHVSLSIEDSPKQIRKQQERVQLMLSYIHQNYANHVSLQNIADTAHLSKSECNRSFNKTLHITPYEYLIFYRIKQSTELLIDTDMSISEIAQRVGFNHVNHYIQSFKKQYRATPNVYRKSKIQFL